MRTESGAFRLPDGTAIAVTGSATDNVTLIWRRLDGTFGRVGADGVSLLGATDRPDGHSVALAEDGSLIFDGVLAERIDLDVTDCTFDTADGTRLAGRMIMPDRVSTRTGTDTDGPVPVLVLVHGAEFSSAVQDDWMQWLLPAAGVGVFVYDKRGTGDSGGSYTQDYDLLADDVAAATRKARAIGGSRVARIGLRGASQGGWVAPMAALRVEVDFVLVVFGLAVSPLEEDREAAIAQLMTAGHPSQALEPALQIIDAMARVMRRQVDGWSELDELCDRYRDQPWYADLRGNIFGVFKALRGDERDRLLADVLAWRTPLDHDSMPILRAVEVPQLWILGADDLDAPPGETLRRLARLQAEGRDISTRVFAGAEHGMTMYDLDADGDRVDTRYPDGYLPLIVDFAAGRDLGRRPGTDR